MGWMIAIGDGVHNFVDGLAIGVAFTVTWQTGVSTAIAVCVHEFAHEFGEFKSRCRQGSSTFYTCIII